ncbi:MAG TPA: bifunctional glutamate N-acetyltransferase/amino-acid acetyltransferase ArgJ [Candidatus Hydrogenedentes bacterium]|nr:bifunctional glutamate N-acetyltransferase/amino-acid acetyltransferase ArgJ [Candidatus Hydrogenedentota bacterium]
MNPWTPVDGGVCAPRGFQAAAAAMGIKNPAARRLDCALIYSERPATVAGVFTTNRVKAAPVLWDQGVCVRGVARAIFANSGNANACTGERGIADARETAARVAARLDIAVTEACVASTGVIGVPLPMDRILAGVDACAAALSTSGSSEAARAIMTTDTVPKEMAIALAMPGGTVRIGAIAKGAGMIAPNMATMLCFITTDGAIEPECLKAMLGRAVEQSFNCICVDNDMSTNDTVLMLANGASGVTIDRDPESTRIFEDGLRHVCAEMARALVRDGEGATRFVTIEVSGAADDRSARTAAQSVARSMLCKAAFHGGDPNWGRIACAVGYSGVDFEPSRLRVRIGNVTVMAEGLPTDYREDEAAAAMKERDIYIGISLGDGPGRAVCWTSDLSAEYVRINADYRS